MKTFFSTICYSLLMAMLFVACPALAQAQQKLNDPLNKPDLWARIKQDPQNDRVWAAYFGKKDWADLEDDENDSLRRWKKALLEELQPTKVDHEKMRYYAEKEKELTNYIQKMEVLKSNVSKNFVIIEELFELTFDELGLTYTFYSEKYPDGDYNMVRWVEEIDKIIVSTKREKIYNK